MYYISNAIHGEKVDEYYGNYCASIALSLANQADGDLVQKLRDAADGEGFAEIRKKADETGDEELIRQYLADQGLLEAYEAQYALHDQIRQDMQVKYVYTHDIRDGFSVYLISAPDGIEGFGYVGPNAEEYAMYTSNVHIAPGVSYLDGEWLCTACEPVYNSKGEAVATVGVDVDMNEVMADRERFKQIMLVYTVVLSMLSVIIGIIFISRFAIKPIVKLTEGAKAFTDEEKGYKHESVISLDIHSGDEIEDLYKGTRAMQEKILDYIENITRITAEKERIGAELNVATQIQASMLPRIFPPFPDRKEFDLFASMDPAKEVGGDFYDFFLIDEDHLAMVMADVSGKGVPAALFMAISKTLIKDRAQESLDPSDILMNANNQLATEEVGGLFVTVLLVILDVLNVKLYFADAG